MERKLVTVQTIKDIQPIQNADAIEVATVLGWKVVVKKDEFKVGDRVLYFEIDSFLPIKEQLEFLRKSSYKKLADGTEGFRLKTIKLRGTLSQGLILPLSALNYLMADPANVYDEADVCIYIENTLGDRYVPPQCFSLQNDGTEVTDLIGVIKYDPPIPAQLSGIAKGNFPSFITKTDQERIQNVYDEFKERYAHLEFEVTVKLDGASATYYIRDGEFGVCSRNLELEKPEPFVEGQTILCPDGVERPKKKNTYWSMVEQYGIDHILSEFHKETGRNIALQGEIIGEGIQGNKEKIRGQEFYVFDIFDIDESRYLLPTERSALLRTHFPQLKSVPMYVSEYSILKLELHQILKMADGPSMNSNVREGLVFKSHALVNSNTLTFKAISNEFLLQNGE